MEAYMRNQNILKIIVFLMIAVILAAGIVSCFTDVTEPNVSQTTEPPDPDPGQTGPVTPGDTNTSTDPEEPEKPEKPTFPRDTLLYVPFRGGGDYGDYLGVKSDYVYVSSKDTNTLLRYWKEMIGRKDEKLKGNSRRFFIRDGDNRAKADDPSIREKNHYYYFDKNFDLVYHRQGKGTLKIRKLVGAVMVCYYRGKYANVKTVGGLYKNLIENAGQYNWMHFSKFMHAGYNPDNDTRKVGDLEILVLNEGFGDNGEYGVDAYYNVWNKGGYRDNIDYFLGKPIDNLNIHVDGDPLNQKVNLTYNTAAFNFKFVSLQPEAWHLEEHPEGDWVQR